MLVTHTLCALLMTLFLLLSCGSGITNMEDPKTTFLNSIANLGKGFLDVFTSLSDMVAGAFGINADTKKSDIGKYFSDIENTINTVKEKLNTVVAENGNYPKVKEVVDHFITNTLDKIAEGTKKASKGATGGAVGEVVKSDAAGIALRSMAKDGKFAAKAEEKSAHAVNGVAASAVGKTLSILIIAIRNTVDSGLKSISEALATVTQEDKSVDSATPTEAATSGNNK
ncbi:variable large family protein (plasmid) [Borrelia puertoricensis]|uniref:variable large family protein n=1 Tax=Borrelia puertoricensis TaxID=2756107 RepID=UPI003EB6EB4C